MTRFSRSSSRRGARHRLGEQRGFTIVEVAMAAMVLLFGIASSIVGMQLGYRSLDLARTLTLTSQVLQSEMEVVRMKAWGDIIKLESDAIGDAPLQAKKITDVFVNGAMPRDFKLTRNVADVVVEGGVVVMREITVTATWRTVDGIWHTRSNSTQYCMEGLNDYYVTNPSS